MKIELNFIIINHVNLFYYFVVLTIYQLVILQPPCNASMGTITVKGVSAEILSSSESIVISRTTIHTLATQERCITINDASGTMMVTGFSTILTSTTLNSSHNGIVMVSGNITVTLPEASSALGVRYTIKKIDTSSNTITILGLVDGKSDLQLSEQYSYITMISDGNAWYKIAESLITTYTNCENLTYISNSLGMNFRLIPAGTFVMGSPTDELGRESDETQYTVTISNPFYIQTTEVTQGQWKMIMGNNPSYSIDCGYNCPVENVSWEDAESFIIALNAMGEGTYTLPTEAQWEYAARAGSNTAFAYGDISNTSTDSNLNILGWYNSNSDSTTHAVAQKQANAWGLYDIHGNVMEWCMDWYGFYPSGSIIDPIGALSGSNRVLRGGGRSNNSKDCRLSRRRNFSPDYKSYTIGIRLLRFP